MRLCLCEGVEVGDMEAYRLNTHIFPQLYIPFQNMRSCVVARWIIFESPSIQSDITALCLVRI